MLIDVCSNILLREENKKLKSMLYKQTSKTVQDLIFFFCRTDERKNENEHSPNLTSIQNIFQQDNKMTTTYKLQNM